MDEKKSRASIISLAEAVRLLKIHIRVREDSPLVPTDVGVLNVECPECYQNHSGNRLTMNLNFEENVFGCPRCGFSGGVYKYISYYTHWPYAEVESKVRAGLLGTFTPSDIDSSGQDDSGEVTDVSNYGRLIAPVRQRDEVYSALLELLSLASAHRDNLRSRGLSDSQIDKIGFKSLTPFTDPLAIPKKLIAKGLDLRGVPGFGLSKSGQWILASQKNGSGFLIPNRNAIGCIQGFQIRFDNPGKSGKYGYFTSVGLQAGTRCQPWCCWAGEDLRSRRQKADAAGQGSASVTLKPFDVLLIEGPLKAYIVNAVTGSNLISVPGVNALKMVFQPLQEMLPLGLRTVYIAYDMDAETNSDVKKQLNRVRENLDSLGIPQKTLEWDHDYKGLDDYVTGSPNFQKILSCRRK